MSETDLSQKVQQLYDRSKLFPEVGKTPQGDWIIRGDAYLALLELRNLAPDIVLALTQQRPRQQNAAD